MQIACGASHSLAITVNAVLYSWGKNNQGQGGHGDTTVRAGGRGGGGGPTHADLFSPHYNNVINVKDRLTPTAVSALNGVACATMAGGWEHTLILLQVVCVRVVVCVLYL